MNNVVFLRGELRLIWLYMPAVILQAWFATRDVFIIDAYWDSVFYKQLAFGFADWQNFSLKNHFPIPPLYSFILSFGVITNDFMMTESVQSWINPALYYLSIYPIYLIVRLFLPERYGLIAVAVFITYPTGVFTQWTFSENLAYPLSLTCFYFAAKTLVHESYRTTDTLGLIIFCTASLLTRIQSIFIVIPLLCWCIWRRWRNQRSILGLCFTLMGSLGIWILLLERLGYFESKADWFFYSDTNEVWNYTLWEYTLFFLNRFFSHWTALWIEGGLIIPSLPISLLVLSLFNNIKLDKKLQELLTCWFIVSFCLLTIISLYRLMRMDVEAWSVSLRHISYVNLWAIPLVIFCIEQLKQLQNKTALITTVVVINIIFSSSLFMSGVWEGLTRPETYFVNSPSLDVLDQFESYLPWTFFVTILIVSIFLVCIFIFKKRAGLVCWAGILLYLYGCSMEYALDDRDYAINLWGYEDIQLFCDQYQKGRWNNYTIYCVEKEEYQFLRPNLIYWINKESILLHYNSPKPDSEFLLLTMRYDQVGELVFQSGRLKAYIHKN